MIVNIALLQLYYWRRLSSPEFADDSTFGWCCYRVVNKTDFEHKTVEERRQEMELVSDRDGASSPDVVVMYVAISCYYHSMSVCLTRV